MHVVEVVLSLALMLSAGLFLDMLLVRRRDNVFDVRPTKLYVRIVLRLLAYEKTKLVEMETFLSANL